MKSRALRLAFYIFLAALAGILLFVWTTYSNLKISTKETKEVTETLQSLKTLENIFDDCQDIETGYRGYLISKDSGFLAPYEKGINRLGIDTTELLKTGNFRPGRPNDIKELLFDLSTELEIASHLIRDKSNDRIQEATHQPLIKHAKELMDHIRAIILKMENEDRAMLNEANLTRQESAQKTTNLFTGFAVLFILFFVSVFFYIRKNMVHNQDVEREIQYLGSLVDQTSDAMYSTNTNFIIKSWNKGAEKMYGFSRTEAIGQSSHKLLQTEVSNDEVNRVKSDLDQNGSYQGEFKVYGKNDIPFIVLSSLTVLKDEMGNNIGYVIAHRDITERKRLEENIRSFNTVLEAEVQEKTNEIKEVFERVNDAFISIDLNWKFNYVNKKAEQLLGKSAQELLGKYLEDIYPEKNRPVVINTARQAMQTQQNTSLQSWSKEMGLWFEIFYYPSPKGLSIYLRDITESKKNMEEIVISNERFRLIARATNDAIWELNLKTNITWANSNHQRLYGLTMADPVPDNAEWQKRIHPEDRENVMHEFNSIINLNRNSWTKEYRFLTEELGYQYIYDRTFIIRDEKGEPVRMLGSMMNIDDLKKAEANLEQERNLLRTLIDNIPDYIFVKDDTLRYRINNKARIALLGFTNEAQTIGKTVQELLKDPFAEGLLAIDKKVLDSGRAIFNMEEEMPLPNGETRFLLTSKIPLIDQTGNTRPLLLGISRDITEQKRLIKQIGENNIQLKQLADRLQNIREDERLSISKEIHEEIGQRMSVMKMDIAWIAKKLSKDDAAMEKIENTLKIIDGTIQIVRQLAAKLRPGILDDLGLIAALEWQCKDFEERSGIPVQFFTNMDDQSIPSNIAIPLFRIFQESIQNSIKNAQASVISCSFIIYEENELILTVEDDGKGSNNSFNDPKVNLEIMSMKERAEKIGGVYEISSSEGQGTAVTVRVTL